MTAHQVVSRYGTRLSDFSACKDKNGQSCALPILETVNSDLLRFGRYREIHQPLEQAVHKDHAFGPAELVSGDVVLQQITRFF